MNVYIHEKICIKPFVADKLPHVMSPVSVGSEDYRFVNEKSLGVWSYCHSSLPEASGSGPN